MTRYNDFKINDITIMQKTMLLWDNAHYTQNDNHALSSWCFKRRWRLNIKVKEWLCAKAFYFKNRGKNDFLGDAYFVNEC